MSYKEYKDSSEQTPWQGYPDPSSSVPRRCTCICARRRLELGTCLGTTTPPPHTHQLAPWKLAFQKLHCSRALAILTSSDCECTTHTPSACSGQLGLSRLCWGQASTTCVAFWWTELTSENPSEEAPLNWQWSVPIGLAA